MGLALKRPDILLTLCEAIEDSPLGDMVIGRSVTSNKFIRPILRYMTIEWKKVKELIVNMVVDRASRTTSKVESIVLIEQEIGGVFFKPEDVEAIKANLDHIMGQYKAGVLGQLGSHLASARASTVPIVKRGISKLTSVALSREGIQEIVDNFTFQEDFVDKLTLDTVTRIERLTASRYTSFTDLRGNLNREFRIDRDNGILSFRKTTDSLANRVRSGKLSSGDFQIQMGKDIEDHYRKLYRVGKGSPLEAWEEEFVRRQAQGQMKYLDNFANYIETQKGVGKDLTGRINQRASLYAERGSAMYEAGFVASLPDDVLLDWVLQPAEHCPTCPIYAANSPYTKGTLPGFPGEGFHITVCGTNCKCKLRISELYVIELPGEEEIPDLPISVIGGKPDVGVVRTLLDGREQQIVLERADRAVVMETVKERQDNRSSMLKEIGFSDAQVQDLLDITESWVQSSNSPAAGKLQVLENRHRGRSDLFNIGDETIKRSKEAESVSNVKFLSVTPEEEKIAEAWRSYNQRVFLGTNGPVSKSYRGLTKSDYTDDIIKRMESGKTDRINISIRTLHSEDKGDVGAKFFGRDGGLLLERDIKYDEVWDSYLTSTALSNEPFAPINEIIAGTARSDGTIDVIGSLIE